jgi:cyclic beta-1,2-glucan synthetase
VELYKVEPYVIAGDVYSRAPHVGRGGWTWYTGSAGWLYRVVLEAILGLQFRGDRLTFDPCIPGDWKQLKITYRYRSANYQIQVENPMGVEFGVAAVHVDGRRQPDASVRLLDDGRAHQVCVSMGPRDSVVRADQQGDRPHPVLTESSRAPSSADG